MGPFPLVIPLGRPYVCVVHQLRDIINVFAILDQGTDERGPRAMGSDSFFHINPLSPLADNVAQSGMTQFLLGLAAVRILRRLKEKIILPDLTLDSIHPRDILINVMSRRRMDRNLIHLLTFTEVIEKPNALLGFEVR